MNKLFSASLYILAGALVTFVVMTVNAPQPQPQPPVEYQNGFSFDVPCLEHGTHTQVVTGNRLTRVYEISIEGEVRGEVLAEQIAETLEMIKVLDSIKVIPNDTQEPR